MIRKILLFVGDQWRAEALGQTGKTPVRTPALDALAAEGVTFTRHFTQCSPCGPARASLLTGLYLMNHRSVANGTPLDRRFTNIAKEVRKAGLQPYVFGYTDTSQDPRDFFPSDPILTSYENVLPGMNVGYRMTEEFKLWRAYLKDKGYKFGDHHFDPFKVPPLPEDEGHLHPIGPALYKAEDSLCAHMCDAMLDFMRVSRTESWLSYISFLQPHPPFVAPAPYNAAYRPEEMAPPVRSATPDEEKATHPYVKALIDKKKAMDYAPGYYVPLDNLPELEVRRIRATYYGMIQEADDQIARILGALKESGEIDETLVIFTVDHAEMLGDHWMWGKDGFYDGAFHIPLIIRDPRPAADITRGTLVDAFSEHVDILPTILDWLGLEPLPQVDGCSLLPFVEGEAPTDWREAAHYEYDFRHVLSPDQLQVMGVQPEDANLAVLRDERFKYVHFAALPPLLFDLQADPMETRNLAEDPSYAGVLLDYAQRMLSWRMRHADHHLTGIMLGEGGPARLPRRFSH